MPVRHATAFGASTEAKTPVAPDVMDHRTLAGDDLYLAPVVVSPDATRATADGAVAAGEAPRLARDLDLHCPAVTRTREHALSSCAARRRRPVQSLLRN